MGQGNAGFTQALYPDPVPDPVPDPGLPLTRQLAEERAADLGRSAGAPLACVR